MYLRCVSPTGHAPRRGGFVEDSRRKCQEGSSFFISSLWEQVDLFGLCAQQERISVLDSQVVYICLER